MFFSGCSATNPKAFPQYRCAANPEQPEMVRYIITQAYFDVIYQTEPGGYVPTGGQNILLCYSGNGNHNSSNDTFRILLFSILLVYSGRCVFRRNNLGLLNNLSSFISTIKQLLTITIHPIVSCRSHPYLK